MPGAAALAVVAGLVTAGLHSIWLIFCSFAFLAMIGGASCVARAIYCQSKQVEQNDEGRRHFSFLIVTFVGFFSLLMAVLVPPLQSPDELAHINRAYSLLQGNVMLEKLGLRENMYVEKSLLDYGNMWGTALPLKPDVQIKREMELKSRKIRWSESQVAYYNPAAIYFPALYAPASVAMGLARNMSQPPWVVMMWARLGMWGASVCLLGLALLIVRGGFRMMCGVALLPMCLAQFGSGNLDSVTITGTFLFFAIFSWLFSAEARAFTEEVRFCAWKSALLLLGLLALAKPVFLVLLVLPAFLALRDRDVAKLIPGIVILFFVLAWQYHVAHYFSNPNMAVTGSPFDRLARTLMSPGEALALLMRTFEIKARFYWESMVGILGYLDTPLLKGTYTASGILLALALVSDLLAPVRLGPAARSALGVAAVGYVVGAMLLLWVTWTVPESKTIEGVQGRYFLPVLPVLAITFGGLVPGRHWAVPMFQRLVTACFVAYMITLVIDIPTILLNRYWL